MKATNEQIDMAIQSIRKLANKHTKGWTSEEYQERFGEVEAFAMAIGHLEQTKMPHLQYEVSKILQSLTKERISPKGFKILKVLNTRPCRPKELLDFMREDQFANIREDMEALKAAGFVDKYKVPNMKTTGWKEYIRYEITTNGRLALKREEAKA
jgi:hypothetical protein